jgi:hypothetical protein
MILTDNALPVFEINVSCAVTLRNCVKIKDKISANFILIVFFAI